MAKIVRNRIIDNVETVSEEREYWFVRTDRGENFQTFLQNGFIGINWNEITVQDLRNRTELEVKTEIANLYEYNLETSNGKRGSSDIYNKLRRFDSLNRGDIIVIPSENSDYLAFGEVLDDRCYTARAGSNGCDYIKRRRINWLTPAMDINRLDPTFYKIKKSRHSISNISPYDYYIDSVLYDVYRKGNESHFVLKVNAEGEINLLELSEALRGLHQIMGIVNEEFQLGENIDEGTIRIYLQSPGLFNIKQLGLSLLLSALLLGAPGCRLDDQPQHTRQRIERTYQDHREEVDTVRNTLRGMNIQL